MSVLMEMCRKEVAEKVARALKYLSGANMVMMKVDDRKVVAMAFWRGPLEPTAALGLLEDFKEALGALAYEMGLLEPGEVLKEVSVEMECNESEGCRGFIVKQVLTPFP
ncbi:hypothetical protein IPA_06510 [Ignicoccus pacificus DSM 13166]|uniref:Uncharacterized protein n=1 Tax=Ignicoccus pacificus DSM 13166 TaxID=940294 RepID=A0A977PLQ7_9CREN|nr:hypothetical protein IPA_06510 [Ignicoccus pacificus DSM 13166]